jgi:hypothetical protein
MAEQHEPELGVLRDVGDALKAGFRRREAIDIGRAFKRRRLFLLVPAVALVAAAGAFAAVTALKGTPSAPLSGAVAAPSPSPGWGTTRYSVTLSPTLQAGTVGWCIDAEVQVPVPVRVNDVPALRGFLVAQRSELTRFRAAVISNLKGDPATIKIRGQSISLPPVPRSRRARTEVGLRTVERHLREIPQLLGDLAHPRARASLGFQNAIRNLAGVGYQYKAPGQDCGHVATTSTPLVGAPYIGFTGSEYSIPQGVRTQPLNTITPQMLGSTTLTTTAVYVTGPHVAAIRTGPSETVLTKSAGLPNRYRIAVTVKATVEKPIAGHAPLEPNRIYSAQQPPQHAANGALPSIKRLPTAVALDKNGRRIASQPTPITAGIPSIAWKPAQQFVPKYANGGDVLQLNPGAHPPAGACEIDTSHVPGSRTSWGAVIRQIRSFPKLTGVTLMSCAYTSFYLPDGAAPQAAILLDAQNPAAPPPPLPGARQLSRQPDIVNEPIVQLSGTTNLTARRTANAWLVIEGAGSITRQIKILSQLRVCVHLHNQPCHPTTTIPNDDTTTTTATRSS